MSNTEKTETERREAFDRRVRGANLLGYWMIPSRSDGYREPNPAYGPYLWHWDEIAKILKDAVDHVPPEEAHRRFIGFQHPDLEIGTTPGLILGAQLLIPGEVAPCHRHTMDAIRFVTEGDGTTCTVVEGEPFPMERGDLITTPNWSWHDHVSGDTPTIWLDGAVAPLIVNFAIGFSEPHQTPRQTESRPRRWSDHQFGAVRAKHPAFSRTAVRPPYRYPWAETRAALDTLAAGPGDPFDAVTVAFADPETGGPTLPTATAELTLLRGQEKTRAHRHTHAAIYYVFKGEGETVINGETFAWHEGDTFVVPSWAWHAHENRGKDEALLFVLTDEPVMASLGFLREQADEPA